MRDGRLGNLEGAPRRLEVGTGSGARWLSIGLWEAQSGRWGIGELTSHLCRNNPTSESMCVGHHPMCMLLLLEEPVMIARLLLLLFPPLLPLLPRARQFN